MIIFMENRQERRTWKNGGKKRIRNLCNVFVLIETCVGAKDTNENSPKFSSIDKENLLTLGLILQEASWLVAFVSPVFNF